MERWTSQWWPSAWRVMPAVGRMERGEVVARIVGFVRGGLPVARAISRALSERRYRYADPADYVGLVLELDRAVRWALESIEVLPAPVVPAPEGIRVRALPGWAVRRAAIEREVRRVLERPTGPGLSSGLSAGPRCRVAGCGAVGMRLAAVMRDGTVRPEASVGRSPADRDQVVDTEWRCAGHAPGVPAVARVGGPQAGGVRLIKRAP